MVLAEINLSGQSNCVVTTVSNPGNVHSMLLPSEKEHLLEGDDINS